MADNIKNITEETWKDEVFPEWGSWLNEEIDNAKVKSGQLVMWWLANMGVWIKTDHQTNITVDLWCGKGKTINRGCHPHPQTELSLTTSFLVSQTKSNIFRISLLRLVLFYLPQNIGIKVIL